MGQKKIWSPPTGIEPVASQITVGRSNQVSDERLVVSWAIYLVQSSSNRYLGGHGFDSRRGLRIFLCPMLVSLLEKLS